VSTSLIQVNQISSYLAGYSQAKCRQKYMMTGINNRKLDFSSHYCYNCTKSYFHNLYAWYHIFHAPYWSHYNHSKFYWYSYKMAAMWHHKKTLYFPNENNVHVLTFIFIFSTEHATHFTTFYFLAFPYILHGLYVV